MEARSLSLAVLPVHLAASSCGWSLPTGATPRRTARESNLGTTRSGPATDRGYCLDRANLSRAVSEFFIRKQENSTLSKVPKDCFRPDGLAMRSKLSLYR